MVAPGKAPVKKPAPAAITDDGRGWFRTSDLSRVKCVQAAAACCHLLPFVPRFAGVAPKGLPSAAFCCHSLFPSRFQN
jgi:hypothetical protein